MSSAANADPDFISKIAAVFTFAQRSALAAALADVEELCSASLLKRTDCAT